MTTYDLSQLSAAEVHRIVALPVNRLALHTGSWRHRDVPSEDKGRACRVCDSSCGFRGDGHVVRAIGGLSGA